jgi:hypothetical protein
VVSRTSLSDAADFNIVTAGKAAPYCGALPRKNQSVTNDLHKHDPFIKLLLQCIIYG